MSSQDILMNCNLSFAEIKIGVSKIFCIAPSEVLVVEEISGEPIPNFVRILCCVQELDGEFKQLVSVYMRDELLSDLFTRESLGKFCEDHNCMCLISDDSINPLNPFSMVLIKGIGDYQIVYLSPELLDEGKYVLSMME